MILTKMQKMCKKAKVIQIIKFGNMDFLSNGYMAAYIGAEAPGWEESDIAISLGLSEDVRNAYIKHREVKEREAIDVDSMMPAIKMEYTLRRGTQSLRPFKTEDGKVFFVDEDRLKVFESADADTFYIGSVDKTRPPCLFLTVQDFPVGIISPEMIAEGDVRCFAEELAAGLELSEKDGFFVVGQMSIEEE